MQLKMHSCVPHIQVWMSNLSSFKFIVLYLEDKSALHPMRSMLLHCKKCSRTRSINGVVGARETGA